MHLEDLIEELEKADPAMILPDGFGSPGCYRGYYAELAFDPECDVTVGSMLEHAKSAMGTTYQGYKGGDYKMGKYSVVHIAEYGNSDGAPLSPLLLRLMLERGVTP